MKFKLLLLILFVTILQAELHIDTVKNFYNQTNQEKMIETIDEYQWNKRFSTFPPLLERSNLVRTCNIERNNMSKSISLNLENNLNKFMEATEDLVNDSADYINNEIDSLFNAVLDYTSEEFMFNAMLYGTSYTLAKGVCTAQSYTGSGKFSVLERVLSTYAATSVAGGITKNKKEKIEADTKEDKSLLAAVDFTKPMIGAKTGIVLLEGYNTGGGKSTTVQYENLSGSITNDMILSAQNDVVGKIRNACIKDMQGTIMTWIEDVLGFLGKGYKFTFQSMEMCMQKQNDPLHQIKIANYKMSQLRTNKVNNFLNSLISYPTHYYGKLLKTVDGLASGVNSSNASNDEYIKILYVRESIYINSFFEQIDKINFLDIDVKYLTQEERALTDSVKFYFKAIPASRFFFLDYNNLYSSPIQTKALTILLQVDSKIKGNIVVKSLLENILKLEKAYYKFLNEALFPENEPHRFMLSMLQTPYSFNDIREIKYKINSFCQIDTSSGMYSSFQYYLKLNDENLYNLITDSKIDEYGVLRDYAKYYDDI
jgi:hypothetical protein